MQEIVHEILISPQKTIVELVSCTLALHTQTLLLFLLLLFDDLLHCERAAFLVLVLVEYRWEKETGEYLLYQTSLLFQALAIRLH